MQKIRDTVDIHLDQQNRNFGSLYSPHTIQSKPPLSHLCKFNTIPCVMMLSTRQSTAHCALLLGKPLTHTRTHAQAHACTHARGHAKHACSYARTHTRTCMHTLTRVPMHTRTHMNTRTYEHMHTCTSTCMRKHMHAHAHAHTHAHARARARTQNIPGDSSISESAMRPSVVRETQRLRNKKLDRGAEIFLPGVRVNDGL